MERIISLMGVLVIGGIAFFMCPGNLKRKIEWRPILSGLALLFFFAFLVLKTPLNAFFDYASRGVDALLAFSKEGSQFVFGGLVTNMEGFGFIFAFQVLPTIIFFSALMAILYHTGVMPFVIRCIAKFVSKILGVSAAESFSTVSDIFVGQTEAPLVIRPYIAGLTQSELMACMVAGFATTAGGVLAAYVGMLKDYIPGIGGHLIACSVMCAPASLVIAKLMMPETQKPQTLGETKIEIPKADVNVVDAAARGTSEGLQLALNVGAMLIAFLALTALLNFFFKKMGTSLQEILGFLFWPLSWIMGVPAEDCTKVGALLGQKMVLNEFVSYSQMGQMLKETNGSWLTARGQLIASYALCGFANLGSIGIQIGGYSALCPERRGDLSKLAFRAMIGGTLATCMVASVAGVLV